jgi:hypothetical protein
MKKLSLSFFAAFAAVTIYSCSPEKGTSIEADPHVTGYNLDSSANIDVIKASFKDMVNFDTASYKSKYVDTAIFNDNMATMRLADNVAIFKKAKDLGVTIKVNKIGAIWESVMNKPDKNGVKNGVFSFASVTWTRAGKSATVFITQVDAFNKEGKIVEEWLTYDASELKELLK